MYVCTQLPFILPLVDFGNPTCLLGSIVVVGQVQVTCYIRLDGAFSTSKRGPEFKVLIPAHSTGTSQNAQQHQIPHRNNAAPFCSSACDGSR